MELQKTIKERLLEQKVLKIYSESDAGEQLKDKLADTIANAVRDLMMYRTMQHAELISHCARIEAALELGQMLKDADTKVRNLEEELEEETS